MQIKLGDLLNCKDALAELLSCKMHLPVAWKLTKLLDRFNSEAKTFEDLRIAKIKELGVEQDGKIEITPNSENFPAFVSAINELVAIDVELDCEKVKLENLTDAKLAPTVLSALKWLIEE